MSGHTDRRMCQKDGQTCLRQQMDVSDRHVRQTDRWMSQADMSDRRTCQTDGHVGQTDMSHRWTCQTDGHVKQHITLGSVSNTMSTIAASWYSFQASAFFAICSASAFAFASMANASASPFIYPIKNNVIIIRVFKINQLFCQSVPMLEECIAKPL